MKLTKSELNQIIKEEISQLRSEGILGFMKEDLQMLGILDLEGNFIKKNKLEENSWSNKYKALEAETIAKLENEDADVMEVLTRAINSAEGWLTDEEDQQNFLLDVISAKPELGDPREWIEGVFQSLRDDAYADHLSRLEDEATNP